MNSVRTICFQERRFRKARFLLLAEQSVHFDLELYLEGKWTPKRIYRNMFKTKPTISHKTNVISYSDVHILEEI